MVRQCVSPPSVSPPETWSPLPVTFEHTGYPVVFLYWCNHWCLNVTKQRVKAELANNTQTVVFQLRFVWSMRSPPSTVWQILLIIYTVVGTAAHDFVIVWWDCIVFGVVCSLCFLGFFCFSCLTMHIIACSYQVVDILIYILVTVCQISFFSFFLLFLILYLQSTSRICSHDLHYNMDM